MDSNNSRPVRRKITERLIAWKDAPTRMPLIVYGARQVGKTYTILDFGETHYKNVVYFNFEDNDELHRIFDREKSAERLLQELSAKSGQTILAGDTLLFFDEVQTCEKALMALGEFCTNAPAYHIIAAGSVLGVSVNRRRFRFPVGKVAMLTLYPLDFEEFLWLQGEEDLALQIRAACDAGAGFDSHDRAMDLFRVYLVCGGMPRALLEHRATGNFNLILAQQKSIGDAYVADMTRQASPMETAKIMAAYDSIPKQLIKENRKFQYSVIRQGARSTEFDTPIDWLRAGGVAFRSVKVTEGKLPLLSYQEKSSFKIYMSDTGLLFSKLSIPPGPVLTGVPGYETYAAALFENAVAAALVQNGYTPFYWESAGRAEIEFVIQDREGNVVPCEVKPAGSARGKNLQQFISRYGPKYALRISESPFAVSGKIRTIPYYALFCL
ncbi:ATP-binding protein [Oscillospiraceae bacterium OttesenSCG-928-F05]|nr:ATP-binding protein [Oscillospiraceae bacterium OttesenSCG-928-F05]